MLELNALRIIHKSRFIRLMFDVTTNEGIKLITKDIYPISPSYIGNSYSDSDIERAIEDLNYKFQEIKSLEK